MKRLKLLIVALALSITSAVPGFAAMTHFKDVPAGSKYHQEIHYFYEKGIIKGTGNGYFRPGAAITYKDYLVMLNNHCGYGYNLYKYIVYGDVLEILDIKHVTKGKYISKMDVMQQACFAMDIEPYSASFYNEPQMEKFSALTQDEKDIVLMCAKLGLINLDDETYASLIGPVTRGEATKLLYGVSKYKESGNKTEMPKAARDLVRITFDAAVPDIEKRQISMLNDVADLPDWLVADYNKKGMKISVYPYEVNAENEGVAGRYHTSSGITMNSKSKNTATIYHEFGHHLYFGYVVDINKRHDPDEAAVEKLYLAEKDAIASYYRDYGATNQKEFFAEFFVLYLKAHDDGTTAALQQAMPKTYAYMDELIKSLGGL